MDGPGGWDTDLVEDINNFVDVLKLPRQCGALISFLFTIYVGLRFASSIFLHSRMKRGEGGEKANSMEILISL